MYNRYTPSPDGTFERTVVPDAPPKPQPAAQEAVRAEIPLQQPPPPAPKPPELSAPAPPKISKPSVPHLPDRPLRRVLPQGIDIGDLLMLLILLLLLVETDEDDSLTLLLTIAAVMLL